MYYTDGSYFEGYWEYNKISGHGRKINREGDVYEGFHDEKNKRGKGQIIYFNGG